MRLSRVLNKSILVTGMVIALSFCIFWGFIVMKLTSNPKNDSIVTAALTIIPVNTLMPTVTLAAATPSSSQSYTGTDINTGEFVQIVGTNGAGLHIRSGPSLEESSNFLGMDDEVFKVMEGPQENDGFLWWFLVAPYDENRSGWAASDFLRVVTEQ